MIELLDKNFGKSLYGVHGRLLNAGKNLDDGNSECMGVYWVMSDWSEINV